MKQSFVHWREINMRAKYKNLPEPLTRCLILIPGTRLETVVFKEACGKPYFLRGSEYIKPVTGMLWVPTKELTRKEAVF